MSRKICSSALSSPRRKTGSMKKIERKPDVSIVPG